MMLSNKLFPGFLRRLFLLVLLTLPLCAMMCTEIVYDTGYEATIHRAATVDSVKVTFSDGVSVLEQKTIGPESDSIVVMSSQERTGGFMLTVGVFCTGASDWEYVVPLRFYVDDTTRVFIRDSTPIDCEHIAKRNVVYAVTPRSIFHDHVYP